MSTTSLKLPDELKQRTVTIAQRLGVSPHAFMLGAIEQATMAAEQRADFWDEARAAREAMLASGTGRDADTVHAYLKARVAGKKSPKPRAGSWRS